MAQPRIGVQRPTGDEILDGMYAVLNCLEALHALGCSQGAGATDPLTYNFCQLAGVLAAKLTTHCSDLADYVHQKERMP